MERKEIQKTFQNLHKMENKIIEALNSRFTYVYTTISDIGSFLIRSVDEKNKIIKDSDILLSNNYGDGDNRVFILNHRDFDQFKEQFGLWFDPFHRFTKKQSFAVMYHDCDDFIDSYIFSKKTRTKSISADIYTLEKTMIIVDYDG